MGSMLRKTALLAALGLAASASPASASVTIGQVAPAAPPGCTANFDHLQLAVAAGASYTVPPTVASGKITSWSTNANATPGTLTLKVFRQVAGLTYSVVGHDGPRTLNVSSLNTFAANVPVKAGDLLGVHNPVLNVGCLFNTALAGDSRAFLSGDLADGASGTFAQTTGARVNVSAVIDPTNTFTFGTTTRNKKKGTAAVTVNVPNPGTLAVSGNGVKGASATAAATNVAAAGAVKLTIRAKGKKSKTLNSTGKVKLSPTITFTPTGGVAAQLSTKVKLKKNL